MFDTESTTPSPTPRTRPRRPGLDDDYDGGWGDDSVGWDSEFLGSFSIATWVGIIILALTLLNLGQIYLRKYFPERFQQCKVSTGDAQTRTFFQTFPAGAISSV